MCRCMSCAGTERAAVGECNGRSDRRRAGITAQGCRRWVVWRRPTVVWRRPTVVRAWSTTQTAVHLKYRRRFGIVDVNLATGLQVDDLHRAVCSFPQRSHCTAVQAAQRTWCSPTLPRDAIFGPVQPYTRPSGERDAIATDSGRPRIERQGQTTLWWIQWPWPGPPVHLGQTLSPCA